MFALHGLRGDLPWLELGADAHAVDVAEGDQIQKAGHDMTLTLLVAVGIAFLLGVLVARLAGWWFVARVLGLLVWMAGLVFVLKAENAQLRSAVEAEQARESEALRRAQMELASQVGSRRWP